MRQLSFDRRPHVGSELCMRRYFVTTRCGRISCCTPCECVNALQHKLILRVEARSITAVGHAKTRPVSIVCASRRAEMKKTDTENFLNNNITVLAEMENLSSINFAFLCEHRNTFISKAFNIRFFISALRFKHTILTRLVLLRSTVFYSISTECIKKQRSIKLIGHIAA